MPKINRSRINRGKSIFANAKGKLRSNRNGRSASGRRSGLSSTDNAFRTFIVGPIYQNDTKQLVYPTYATTATIGKQCIVMTPLLMSDSGTSDDSQIGGVAVFDISTDTLISGTKYSSDQVTASVAEAYIQRMSATIRPQVAEGTRQGIVAIAIYPLAENQDDSLPANLIAYDKLYYDWVRKQPNAKGGPANRAYSSMARITTRDFAGKWQSVGAADKATEVNVMHPIIRVAISYIDFAVSSLGEFDPSHATFTLELKARLHVRSYEKRFIQSKVKMLTKVTKNCAMAYQDGIWQQINMLCGNDCDDEMVDGYEKV
jgi:hypothetical protein